jgi:hypothetical protein
MVCLILFGGIHILGLGFTVIRLAYDEWEQWPASRMAVAAKEGRRGQVEYASWNIATM